VPLPHKHKEQHVCRIGRETSTAPFQKPNLPQKPDHSQHPLTIPLTMSVRTVRSMRSLPSMRRTLHSSSTQPKPSHLLSSQRDTSRTHYAGLTVPALKQECRQRGLKLTGKKVDLVERLVGFDQTKPFSSTASASSAAMYKQPPTPSTFTQTAKEFSTTSSAASPEVVDYTLPKAPKPEAPAHPVAQIPVSPDREAVVITKRGLQNDTGASAGDIHVADGGIHKVSSMNVDLGSGAPQYDEEKLGYKPKYEIPSKDKSFLAVLGAAIAAWWGSEYFTKNDA